jgi:hypothetical protein
VALVTLLTRRVAPATPEGFEECGPRVLLGGVAWVTLEVPPLLDTAEVVAMTLEAAISDLQQTLTGTRTAANWRWLLRQQLSAVRDALRDERFASWDGWLAARSGATDRERQQLLGRITSLGSGLLDRLDTDRVASEVHRLINDVEHYRQKMHDLVYDSVSMEIGGSE